MSRRSLFPDLQTRRQFICQACLSNSLCKPTVQQSWALRHSSSQIVQVRQYQQRNHKAQPLRGRRSHRSPIQQSSSQTPQTSAASKNDAAAKSAAASLLRELTHSSDEPLVNFFEQDEKGKRSKLAGAKGFSDSVSGTDELKDFKIDLAGDMRALLSDLDKDGTLQSIGITDIESVAKEMEAGLGDLSNTDNMEEKLDAYIKSLEDQLGDKAEGFEGPEDMDDEFALEDDGQDVPGSTRSSTPKSKKRAPVPQIPTDMWTYSQRRRLSRLNAILERVHRETRRGEELTEKTVQSVWKSYNLARQTLAKGWGHVPLNVWDQLWSIFSADEEQFNAKRFTYLSLLARDMSEAHVALNPSQQLITMEAMFVDGFEAKAIDNWKRCITTLGDGGSDTFQEFWELGVRMFSQAGDLAQAERAINKLFEHQLEPRIMMPYIQACAVQATEESHEKAWAAYQRMRGALGDSMGLEDYDQVISFFLTTNQTERALHAFVDMMTSGTVNLRGRAHLPSQIGNKFFFGKWLKRLIGANDLEGAYSVFKFMRSKGIEAAPIQINGLIGAWFRTGGAEDIKHGEEVAWQMVRARVDFVEQRNKLAGVQKPIKLVGTFSETSEPMPKATLETFCLLAENYRARGLQKPMEELWDAFGKADIRPDAFMLNQLMESHSQFGNVQEARELYHSFVHERGVKPDPYTFMALWKMLDANRLSVVAEEHIFNETRFARETFAEMVRFLHIFKSQPLEGQLARKILHTMRRLKDNVGVVMALRAFESAFGYAPPEVLVLEMAVGSTNLAWDNVRSRQKIRLAKSKIDAHVVHRQKKLGLEEVALDAMTPEQRGEAMLDYLKTIYLPDGPDLQEHLIEAAQEMGVYDIIRGKKI